MFLHLDQRLTTVQSLGLGVVSRACRSCDLSDHLVGVIAGWKV